MLPELVLVIGIIVGLVGIYDCLATDRTKKRINDLVIVWWDRIHEAQRRETLVRKVDEFDSWFERIWPWAFLLYTAYIIYLATRIFDADWSFVTFSVAIFVLTVFIVLSGWIVATLSGILILLCLALAAFVASVLLGALELLLRTVAESSKGAVFVFSAFLGLIAAILKFYLGYL